MRRESPTQRLLPSLAGVCGLFLAGLASQVAAQPIVTVDLASLEPGQSVLRVLGSEGTGAFGVPVAGGPDVDGDGFGDLAMAAMTASPEGRTRAGSIYLVFGDGSSQGEIDTASGPPRVLRILGAQGFETAGSEIWIDDVTGDGLADLLICRQNYSLPDRAGAGALTIVPGSPRLRQLANDLASLDLAAPPAELLVTTIVGREAGGRLCIWVRTGDVTGEGVADLVVGADQETTAGIVHAGAAYLVRGGASLATGDTYSLTESASPSFPLSGSLVRLEPDPPRAHGHFGATVQIGDLDGNGRAEVAAAEALLRAGASLQPTGGGAHSGGGAPRGKLHLFWDQAFSHSDPWPAGTTVHAGNAPSLVTLIQGGAANVTFGEEILLDGDYDGDGRGDLFVGDLAGMSPNGVQSGLGHVLFGAEDLKGQSFSVDQPPSGTRHTTFYGPQAGSIAADTAVGGDFDADGIDDLAFSAPHASPLDRSSAGQLYVFLGGAAGWPAVVNLEPGSTPSADQLEWISVLGARGTAPSDFGDTLAYSAAAGDLDGDGRTDLITNEMLGNGSSAQAVDTGNLIALSGTALLPCRSGPTTLCLGEDASADGRFEVRARWRTAGQQGQEGAGAGVELTEDSGTFWFFSPDNVELIVKVLNGCAINGRYWVFAAGLTNVGVTLEVRDTRAKLTRTWAHAPGSPFDAIQDTEAFATCP